MEGRDLHQDIDDRLRRHAGDGGASVVLHAPGDAPAQSVAQPGPHLPEPQGPGRLVFDYFHLVPDGAVQNIEVGVREHREIMLRTAPRGPVVRFESGLELPRDGSYALTRPVYPSPAYLSVALGGISAFDASKTVSESAPKSQTRRSASTGFESAPTSIPKNRIPGPSAALD